MNSLRNKALKGTSGAATPEVLVNFDCVERKGNASGANHSECFLLASPIRDKIDLGQQAILPFTQRYVDLCDWKFQAFAIWLTLYLRGLCLGWMLGDVSHNGSGVALNLRNVGEFKRDK